MELQLKSLRKSINKAYLKEVVDRASFNRFKAALEQLIEQVEAAEQQQEHEEHFKNFLAPFLNGTGFADYYINTSGRIDLAVHNGSGGKSPVGVLIEVKRPSNKTEMITGEQLNRKAMHEAVLYYLEQRLQEENTDLKQIIITNLWEWFVFDAQEFERCFYKPSALRKTYKAWKTDQKVSSNNDFMYREIARFMASREVSLSGVRIDLREEARYLKAKEDSEPEKKLIPLYKFFSPVQLLKEPFANDSNTLNREFYRELLYILGLEETKDGSTRYIERVGKEERQQGSLIENTIRILESENRLSRVEEPEVRYGKEQSDQLFNIAMELGITWINRILFLKLLEAQLFRYHRQAKAFRFLNIDVIDDYDELNKLFFQVLAKKEEDRPGDLTEKYGHIPYLNSSLFDLSALEHQTIVISGLDDHARIPVYPRSVLTAQKGNTLNTLEYLFRFLDAYDFSAEKGEEIRQERKTLINASVLGLIFEKINGYKDGSFYTPGFITEYMARETLRKAVVDKFALSPASPLPRERGPRGEDKTTPGTAENEGKKPAKGNPRGMSGEPGKKLPDALIAAARELRQNQTEAEELLWQLLRNRQLNNAKFRRQHPIREGFILDFYCHAAKLAVELDGGYHDTEEQQAADAERTRLLNEMGIRVIRFRNEEVLEETERVLREIARALERPLSGSLPVGERTPAGEGLTFTDIYNAIGRDISIEEANELINSITICDPAVGSGHFLVSCLNELLAIKSELGILCDTEGKRLRDVKVTVENDELTVENDELIVTVGDEELFERGKTLVQRKVAPERQRVQQTLFREKRQIIENGLFGVDINPNSVKICRLRLWIELLKRAYYTEESGFMKLEVLPNIDINIKQGNSLVSRFDLDSDLSSVFKDSEHSLEDYKEAVRSYKHTGDRAEKQRLQQLIADIKAEYSTTLTNNRPINKKLSRQRGRLELMQNADLFGENKFSKKEVKKQEQKVRQLEEQKAEEESGAFYRQAFEWRFEFPEVLDGEGRFTGFDVVIGNPPYGIKFPKDLNDYLKIQFETNTWRGESYLAFVELGQKILKTAGKQGFIIPDTLLNLGFTNDLRQYLLENTKLQELVLLPTHVFENATVDTILLFTEKRKPEEAGERKKVRVKFYSKNSVIDGVDNPEKEFYVRLKYWKELQSFNLYSNEEEIKVILKLDQFQSLEEVGAVYSGIKTYEVGKGNPPQTKEIRKIKPYTSEEKQSEDWSPFYDGKHIGRYANYWEQNNWIKYGEWLAAPRDPNIFEGEKILTRKIVSDRLIATYIPEKSYCNTLLFIIKLNSEVHTYKSLLAILNSKLIGWYYRKKFQINPEDTFPQILIRDINQFPIPEPNPKITGKTESLVDQILTTKRNDPEADTTELEAEIDGLVYELYGLSEEEIGVLEESVGN